MAQKIKVPIAEALVVGDSYVIRLRAIDPTTGNDVSGVKVSKLNVTGIDEKTGLPVDVGNPILIGVGL